MKNRKLKIQIGYGLMLATVLSVWINPLLCFGLCWVGYGYMFYLIIEDSR